MSDRALKTLFRELVDRAGGVDAAAACTRVARASLSNYGNPHHPSFAPIDVVARLETLVGEPLITTCLARRAHCALVPVEPVREGDLSMLLAHVGRESGEVFQAYGEALANDGQVCAEERAEISRRLADLARAAHAAMGHLNTTPLAPVPLAQAGGQR